MQQIVEFLAAQAPFDALDPDDLARLAARAEVEYFAPGAVVVAEGRPLTHLWVVRTGALELVEGDRIVDLLGTGDTFGQEWVLSGLAPPMRVRAHEESLCLRIPDPRGFLAHPDRLRVTAGSGRAARARLVRDAGLGRAELPLARLVRPIVWCTAADRVRDAAERIGAAGLSCALVRTGAGLGIVTDVDFRRRVATGAVGVDAPIAELASAPSLTIEAHAAQATALLRMIEHGVHHLVVTGDDGEPAGVLRAVDLAGAEVRDPLLLRSAIDEAADLHQLAAACRLLPALLTELAAAGLPASHIGAIHSAVADAAIRRTVRLLPQPGLERVRHSWVLLGSLARREPLPLSDVDTALIWADDAVDADAIRPAARAVLRGLQQCGFTLCGNGANAHNPVFSRSRSGWIAAARDWQHDPTRHNALLLSAMVADSRPLTDPQLGRSLTETIRSHTRTSQFLRALLDEALHWRPPTGFIRDFVVHHGGEHHGRLDLKPGGLMPVVSLARWIAIASGDATGGTVERLRRGAALGLLTTDEADTLAGGFESIYELLLRHESRTGPAAGPATTFVAPKDLNSLTRRHLRETFRAIAVVQDRADRFWLRRVTG